VADNDDWVQRHRTRPSWPHVLAVGTATALPGLDAPSPENFGVTEATGKVAAMGVLPGVSWPNHVNYAIPVGSEMLPTPAAQDFIYYSRKFATSFGTPPDRKARQNLVTTSKLNPKPGPSRILGLPNAGAGSAGGAGAAATRPPRPVGHQLTVTKPAASVTDDSLRLGLR
jgi:hypothetical protein